MAINLPISTWISYGKITQFLSSDKNSLQKIFNGSSIAPYYSQVLRVTRSLVEFAYNRNPNDETLYQTGIFLRTLIDENLSLNVSSGCISPIINTNPVSQTVSEGANVTFSVSASGTNLSYQWQKDGATIGGATSSSYTITGVSTGNVGNYRCVVYNTCGSAVSSYATLTVNAASITGSYYYGDTDYYAAITGGTDAISYQGTFSITHNSTLLVPFPIGASNNKYLVVRVPRTESDKDTWYNNALNNGTIPDSVFYEVVKPAGLPNYTYYMTRVQSSFDFPTNDLEISSSS